MLTAHQLSKSYGVVKILDDVTFSVNDRERVGLVGPNGGGKTTLVRIIAGVETPDAGSVQFTPRDLRFGYLPQGLTFGPDETLGDFLARESGDAQALSAAFSATADALAQSPHDAMLQRAYEAALSRLSTAPAGAGRVEETLHTLGLDHLPRETPIVFLSGGQKTRLALAGVLLSDPQLLLLDEPTNHLDVGMLEWLEQWLRDYRGAALVVSHDRTFLDRSVTRILDLDPLTHSVRSYTGDYSEYIEQKTAERERQWDQYRDEQAEIRRMKQDIAATKDQALWVERTTTSRQPTVRRYAKKVARKAISREKKLDRYVESDDRVEKPSESWQLKLDFGPAPVGGQDVLILHDLTVGYGGEPGSEPAPLLRDINLHIRHSERVALIGPNGAGKTTLLRTLAGLLPPLTGSARLGSNVRAGYMAQEQEWLAPEANALATIRDIAPLSETDARHFLHFFLFTGDEVFTPIQSLSYGERARLMLACLVARGCNFLMLDEPINHLDVPSRERFEQALAGFDGTILAVVHDRYFIQRFATRVWECRKGRVRERIESV